MKTYAAFSNNDIRENSSSGGLFSVIASEFDVVYGVTMSDDCYTAEYTRCDSKNVSVLRGSKYIQANTGNSFVSIKKDLDNGKNVLVTGTGCQINGLCCYLGKEYDNLLCVEIVCHGVPSPRLWQKYLTQQEAKYGKAKCVNFRFKDYRIIRTYEHFNSFYETKDNNSFMRMFLRDYCLRPSCYECPAKTYRKADITIGDFWGIETVAPELNDGRGISLVITRSEKGQSLFDTIKTFLIWKEVTYQDGVKLNPSEYKTSFRPVQRDVFYQDLEQLDFEIMEKKYAFDKKQSVKQLLFSKTKSLIKKMLCGNQKSESNGNYGLLILFDKKD